jgi:sugar O-acyltransferase (sialic acid O-acetyltransferase NeuD family)
MTRLLYLIGAGGHGMVVLDALLASGVPIKGILDPAFAVGTHRLGIPVLGGDEVLEGLDPGDAVLANGIGAVPYAASRMSVHDRFKEKGFDFVNVVHPSAIVGRSVHLGEGCQLMAGAILQPGVSLGDGVVINTRSSIDHDSLIADHVFVSPGVVLCGGVVVEGGAFIGAGATVLPAVKIGARSVVAAGSVVIRQIPPGTVVAGNPAKEMKRRLPR